MGEGSQGEGAGFQRLHEQVDAVARGEDDGVPLVWLPEGLTVISQEPPGVLVQGELEEPGGARVDDAPTLR